MLDINIINTLVTITVVALFSIPFIAHSIESKKTRKRMLLLLNESSAKWGLSPTVHEIWRNQLMIALDPISSQVIFLETGETPLATTVTLQDAGTVDLEIKSRILQNGEKIIESLILVIHYMDNLKSPAKMEFYNEAKYPSLQNEYDLIKKWKNKLADHIEVQKSKRMLESA